MVSKKPIAIDLFCGAGGMSLGVKQAGFKVAGAFDNEERHIRTYRKNFPSVRAHVLDVGKSTSRKILELSKCESEEIDLLFGGPPCQGFSVGGVRDPNDDRNLLILDCARRSMRYHWQSTCPTPKRLTMSCADIRNSPMSSRNSP